MVIIHDAELLKPQVSEDRTCLASEVIGTEQVLDSSVEKRRTTWQRAGGAGLGAVGLWSCNLARASLLPCLACHRARCSVTT